MRRIHAAVNYGFVGAEIEEDFEFDDNVTDEEIDDEIRNWACEQVDVLWTEE